MKHSALPTVLIVHRREKRAKCTLEPLRSKPDLGLQFRTYPKDHPTPTELENYVRLSVDGPPLTKADAPRGLLLIDATWRLSLRMHKIYDSIPGRSLHGFHTALPRTSKIAEDPHGGLASIEALYLAHRILGRPTGGLLDDYHWAEEFLRQNEGLTSDKSKT